MKKFLPLIGAAAGAIALLAIIKKPGSVYEGEEQNPFEGKRVRFVEDGADTPNADGVRGHLEAVGVSGKRPSGFYARYMKRGLDIVLSLTLLMVLAPVFAIIALAILLDDPGPVLFTQKRIGRDKRYFKLHKFRTMKMSTPHDVPTHMLSDPDAYITRVGAVLRRTSLDELPQVWDILIGNMSMIGPRPALWNQDCLVALRDRYGANECVPGLTGLAQIKGRDELALEDKAKLDGEYCKGISFPADLACLFGTVRSVLRHDGVVEGGTGSLERSPKVAPGIS